MEGENLTLLWSRQVILHTKQRQKFSPQRGVSLVETWTVAADVTGRQDFETDWIQHFRSKRILTSLSVSITFWHVRGKYGSINCTLLTAEGGLNQGGVGTNQRRDLTEAVLLLRWDHNPLAFSSLSERGRDF